MKAFLQERAAGWKVVCGALLSALVLAGCAVLTVDVDVYKGPLANHPDVQLQQAAAMATAATPLLVQLRDESEVLYEMQLSNQHPTVVELAQEVRNWRTNSFYKPAAMDTAGYANVPGSNRSTNSTYLRGVLKSDRAVRINDILGLYDDLPDDYLGALITRLREHVSAARSFWGEYKAATNAVRTAGEVIQSEPTVDRNTKLEIAKALKRINSTPLQAYREWRTNSATPFLQAFQAGIQTNAMRVTNELRRMGSEQGARAASQIAGGAPVISGFQKKLVLELNRVLDAAFKLVAELSSLEARTDCRLGEPKKRIAELAEYLVYPLGTNTLERLHRFCLTNAFNGTNDVITSIEQQPELWSLAHREEDLLTATTVFNRMDLGGDEADFYSSLLNGVDMAVKEFGKQVASLFQRGRLQTGLSTLTESFLHEAEQNRSSSLNPKQYVAQQALLDELVRFAEKVLFLANNNELLEPEPYSSGFVRGAQNLWLNGIGDSKLRAERKTQSYKYILQAIGNSILVQIDELRERGTHNTNSLAFANGELKAIKAAFNSEFPSYLKNVLASIDAEMAPLKSAGGAQESTSTNIAAAKAQLAEVTKKLEAQFPPAPGLTAKVLDEQLTAAAGFLNPEPALITNLWTNRVQLFYSKLSQTVTDAANQEIAVGSNAPSALSGLAFELQRIKLPEEGIQIAKNDQALSILRNSYSALKNMGPTWRNGTNVIGTLLTLSTHGSTNLAHIATNLLYRASVLAQNQPSLSNAQLTNSQNVLSNISATISNGAPLKPERFALLSASGSSVQQALPNLAKLEESASNLIAVLESSRDFAAEIPGCLSNSISVLSNAAPGFSSSLSNLTDRIHWIGEGIAALSNADLALSSSMPPDRLSRATNDLQTGVDDIVNQGLTNLAATATSVSNSVAILISNVPCVEAASVSLAGILSSADPTNRTIQRWKEMKSWMLADMAAFKNLKRPVDDAQTNIANLESKLADLKKQNARLGQLSNALVAIDNWEKDANRDQTLRGLRRALTQTRRDSDKAAPKAGGKDPGNSSPQTTPDQAADALLVLDEFNPPLDLSDLEKPAGTDGGPYYAKDALDALIARLRYEHIRTVAETGEKSPRSTALADAIRIAYQERTGMIFIRPASSYLRTSYPATSLQTDASIGGWKNMLSEHMRRQMPILDSWLEDRDNLSTILEVDKQFWQNINRVRVAGGGRGNYVIAKDDLGNWYVKQYAADPQDVIKSARNLAMFSLGPALGASLPINNAVPGSLLRTNLTSSQGKSLLEFQLETFQSNYVAQTGEIYTNLSQTLTQNALKAKLNSTWETVSTNQATVSKLTALSGKGVQPLVELPTIPKDTNEMEKNLNQTLMSLVQVHYALENALSTSDVDSDTKQAARRAANQVLLNQIGTALQRRRDAIGAYKSGVTVLNSSLNQ